MSETEERVGCPGCGGIVDESCLCCSDCRCYPCECCSICGEYDDCECCTYCESRICECCDYCGEPPMDCSRCPECESHECMCDDMDGGGTNSHTPSCEAATEWLNGEGRGRCGIAPEFVDPVTEEVFCDEHRSERAVLIESGRSDEAMLAAA